MDKEFHKKFIIDFFDNIIDNYLPVYISCDNENANEYLPVIRNMFNYLKEDSIKKYEQENISILDEKFKSQLKTDIESINEFIRNKIEEPFNVQSLIPVLNLMSSIALNAPIIASESINHLLANRELLNSPQVPTVTESFIDKIIKKFNHKEENRELKEETWEGLAKESLKKLQVDFGLKSIHINGNKSWKEIYAWSTDTYKVIEQAQTSIGIEKESTGLQKNLSICFSPSSLSIENSQAAMFCNKNSNTIFLQHLNHSTQLECWQHEYAHVLDNRAGVAYLRSINQEEEYKKLNIGNIFLSSIVMNDTVYNTKPTISPDSQIEITKNWMAETLSTLVGGTDSDSFRNYQFKTREECLHKISENLLQMVLPNQEQDWLKLGDYTKKSIFSGEVVYLSIRILNSIYSFGINNTIDTLNGKDEKGQQFYQNLKSYTQHIHKYIKTNLSSDEFFEQTKQRFSEESHNITTKLRAFINNKGFVYDPNHYKNFFVTSKAALASVNKSILTEQDYWSRTIEIFARATQDLQIPMITGSTEFHDKEYKKKKSSDDFLTPSLNYHERKIMINCLHNLAKSCGVKVTSDIDTLKCLGKELNTKEASEFSLSSANKFYAYSNASGTEEKSQAILNIAQIREKCLNNEDKTQTKTI